MPERRRFGPEAVAQLVLALSAAWALTAAAQGAPAVSGAVFRAAGRLSFVLFLAAFFVPLRPRPRLTRLVEKLAWLVVGLVAAYGFAWSIYPVVPEAVVRTFPRAAAYLLVPLAAVFLASRPALAPHRGLLPCSIGLLVVAAFDTGATLRGPFGAAAVSVFALLALDERGRLALTRLARLGLHAALAGLLALGLTRLLPWAQPIVEAYIASTMNTAGGLGSTGFSLESNLGSVDELTLSPRVLMHVETRQPTKLRAAVYVRFDGRRWELTPTTDVAIECPPAGLDTASAEWLQQTPGKTCGDPLRLGSAPAAELLRTRIVQTAPVLGSLPTPAVALALRRARSITLNNHLLAGPPGTSVETYAVVSLSRASQTRLAGGDPPEVSPLQVPGPTARALRDLADRLAEGAATPQARLAATVAFLQRDYHYSLKPGRFRTQQPVVEFLLEKKRGYCEYFASAAALLLRLQGVPTRYVRGFTVREANRVADRYLVREADAHAWIEAFVPGAGWVEVDPTPAAEYEAAHGSIRGGAFAGLRSWLGGRFAELRAYLGAGDWRAASRRLLAEGRRALAWALGAGRTQTLAAVLGGLLLLAWRRGLLDRWLPPHRRGPGTGDDLAPELRELLAQLETSWRRHGQPRPSSRAWREHLRGLPPQALSQPLRDASEQAIDCFYRARYAGAGVAPEELRSAREALERATQA